jgi:hypothetical protein
MVLNIVNRLKRYRITQGGQRMVVLLPVENCVKMR